MSHLEWQPQVSAPQTLHKTFHGEVPSDHHTSPKELWKRLEDQSKVFDEEDSKEFDQPKLSSPDPLILRKPNIAVNVIAEIAKLMIQVGIEHVEAARTGRREERDIEVNWILKQKDEVVRNARNTLIGGIAAGTASIVAGVVQAGFSARGVTDAQNAFALSNLGQGAGQAIQSAGNLTQSGFNYEATMAQADQKQAEAYEKLAGFAQGDDDNYRQIWNETNVATRNLLKEVFTSMFNVNREISNHV